MRSRKDLPSRPPRAPINLAPVRCPPAASPAVLGNGRRLRRSQSSAEGVWRPGAGAETPERRPGGSRAPSAVGGCVPFAGARGHFPRTCFPAWIPGPLRGAGRRGGRRARRVPSQDSLGSRPRDQRLPAPKAAPPARGQPGCQRWCPARPARRDPRASASARSPALPARGRPRLPPLRWPRGRQRWAVSSRPLPANLGAAGVHFCAPTGPTEARAATPRTSHGAELGVRSASKGQLPRAASALSDAKGSRSRLSAPGWPQVVLLMLTPATVTHRPPPPWHQEWKMRQSPVRPFPTDILHGSWQRAPGASLAQGSFEPTPIRC